MTEKEKNTWFILVLPSVYTKFQPEVPVLPLHESCSKKKTKEVNKQSPNAAKEIFQKQVLQEKGCSVRFLNARWHSTDSWSWYYWSTATGWTGYGFGSQHLVEHPEQHHSKFQRISFLKRRKSPDRIGLKYPGKKFLKTKKAKTQRITCIQRLKITFLTMIITLILIALKRK